MKKKTLYGIWWNTVNDQNYWRRGWLSEGMELQFYFPQEWYQVKYYYKTVLEID